MGKQPAKAARRCIDVLLALSLVATMAGSILYPEIHEVTGALAVLLAALHLVFGFKPFKGLFRKPDACRVALLAMDVLLAACLVGIAASAVVISSFVLSWAPAISGASWARPVHTGCTYWLFVLSFVHAGAHLRLGRLIKRNPSQMRRAAVGVASACTLVIGAWCFIGLHLPAYLAFQVPYATGTLDGFMFRFIEYAFVGAALSLAAGLIFMPLKKHSASQQGHSR